ncbi:MAG: hypothetical protein WAK82_42675 [Streptosporangiaceae bacterium]
MVLARIIEPTSKLDSTRGLEEAGVVPASYPTARRRLRAYAGVAARGRASAASLRAWVSVIHWPPTAGSAPESSAARYRASFWSQLPISSGG